jgi:hypothetical protein
MNWGSDCLLHGRDVRTGDAVMVLIDHHPFWEFWGAWSAVGKPDILTYDEDIGIITWHEYAHA